MIPPDLLIDTLPTHCTVKPVLMTIHSGDMEIALDGWLLIGE